MDQKGYIISGLALLLVIPAFVLMAVFVDMVHTGSETQSMAVQSDVAFYTVKDIESDVPTLTEKILQKTTENVVKTGYPLKDSKKIIKDNLQGELNQLSEKYQNSEHINVTCKVWSVNPSSDPFKIEVNSTIYVQKGNVAHNEHISQNISIIDPDYPVQDPLPFIKCKEQGEVTNTSTKILYGSSLADLLKSKNLTNADFYENATSPLFIRKCPYDPYIWHGNSKHSITLKNCIDNGYMHI